MKTACILAFLLWLALFLAGVDSLYRHSGASYDEVMIDRSCWAILIGLGGMSVTGSWAIVAGKR